MKSFDLILIASLLLVSCGNVSIQPTPTSTLTSTPTQTPSPIPTFTSEPTSTPLPTVTSTPSLPNTIEFKFDKSVPEDIQNEIKVMVNQAYWYYIGLGCSPLGFKISFYNGEGGYTDYINNEVRIKSGIASIKTDSTKTTDSISHEIVHAMCQIAFTQRGNMGSIDLRWLTEAVANNFYAKERITNTGSHFGVTTPDGWDHATAEGLRDNFCEVSPSILERSNADKLYPNDYSTVSEVATTLLVKTTPNGINAIFDYYKLLNKESAVKAFQEAFGRTKEDFYKQYQDECAKGFPSVTK